MADQVRHVEQAEGAGEGAVRAVGREHVAQRPDHERRCGVELVEQGLHRGGDLGIERGRRGAELLEVRRRRPHGQSHEVDAVVPVELERVGQRGEHIR